MARALPPSGRRRQAACNRSQRSIACGRDPARGAHARRRQPDRPLRPDARRRRRLARHRAGRGRGPARPVGLRQDHPAARHRGLRSPGRRPRAGRRRAIDHLPANQRNVGIVFQNYALFPHMTWRERGLWPARAPARPRSDRASASARMLDIVQLGPFGDRLPRQLSGGQQQRVALARAPRGRAPDPAARRAVRRARPEPAARHADRGQAPAAPARPHHHPGDARPGRGDERRRPHRGDEQGHGRAVRHAGRRSTTGRKPCSSTVSSAPPTCCPARSGRRQPHRHGGARRRRQPPPACRRRRRGRRRVLLSVRPEQLALSAIATPGSWPIQPGLSLPLGSQIIHEARTSDGAALKIVEPRLRAPAGAARGLLRARAPDARPSLFPRSTQPSNGVTP